ncbi:MAG: winged helix-turn-helix domain-containing protein [Thermoplasmatota archaeon]
MNGYHRPRGPRATLTPFGHPRFEEATPAELHRKLGIARGTIRYDLARLQEAGLVRCPGPGRVFSPTPGRASLGLAPAQAGAPAHAPA